jgi:hypothetical protein
MKSSFPRIHNRGVVLARVPFSGANPGKVLYLTRQVKDGDFESAFVVFRQAGEEARAQAEESLARRPLCAHRQKHFCTASSRSKMSSTLLEALLGLLSQWQGVLSDPKNQQQKWSAILQQAKPKKKLACQEARHRLRQSGS